MEANWISTMIITERHWDKWVPEPNTGCYLWTGTVCRGYPYVWHDGKAKLVTRLVCEESNGPPPSPEHDAAHKRHCHTSICVNDKHLYWATKSQNSLDRPPEVRMAMSRHARRLT